VPDGDGGYIEVFAPLDPPAMFGSVEPMSARDLERFTNATVAAVATHLVSMPFHPGVTIQTRVSWTDDVMRPHTANVTSLINVDEACHTLQLAVAEQVQ
jgi:hypothetical protein